MALRFCIIDRRRSEFTLDWGEAVYKWYGEAPWPKTIANGHRLAHEKCSERIGWSQCVDGYSLTCPGRMAAFPSELRVVSYPSSSISS